MRDYHIGASSPAARALGGLVAVLAGVAILFGGATREGHLLNAAVRLLSLGVLLFGAWRLSHRSWQPGWKTALILAAGVVAVPLLQLLPLPPFLWTSLPGNREVADIYEAAGMPAPWHGVGLNPEGSLNAALALLPALAMFVATLTLRARPRVVVALTALAFALAGTFLGAAQVAGGVDSALRFYNTTNPDSAVGFFSNRNHQASLQLVAMPLAAIALAIAFPNRRGLPSLPGMVAAGVLLAILAVTTVMTDSRAGLVLYPVVVAACVLLLVRERLPRLPGRTVLAGLAGIVVIGGLAAGGALAARPDLMDELAKDPRTIGLPVITAEAVRHLPFGTGLGTFDDVYRSRERVEGLPNAYLNHAHNDLLEVWLETGMPGLVLIGLFLYWFARRSYDAWRTPGPEGSLAAAGSIIVGTLLLHSLVDYPLRTAAMSALFGFACALLLPYPVPKAGSGEKAADDKSGRLAGPGRRPRLPAGTRLLPWKSNPR